MVSKLVQRYLENVLVPGKLFGKMEINMWENFSTVINMARGSIRVMMDGFMTDSIIKIKGLEIAT